MVFCFLAYLPLSLCLFFLLVVFFFLPDIFIHHLCFSYLPHQITDKVHHVCFLLKKIENYVETFKFLLMFLRSEVVHVFPRKLGISTFLPILGKSGRHLLRSTPSVGTKRELLFFKLIL